jgi:TonB family protein
MKHLCLILIILCSNTVFAKDRLAVLNLEGDATTKDRIYLTDSLRRLAQDHFREKYIVLTKENILTLVPPEDLQKCVGQCEVRIGKYLQAHRVVSGRIFKLEHTYRLVLKVHNTKTSEMLNSVEIIAHSVNKLSNKLESSFLSLMKVRKRTFEDVKKQYLAMKQAKEIEQKRLWEIKIAKERQAQIAREKERQRQLVIEERKRKQIQAEQAKLRENAEWSIDSPFSVYTLKYNPLPKPKLWEHTTELKLASDVKKLEQLSGFIHEELRRDSYYAKSDQDRYRYSSWNVNITSHILVDHIATSHEGIGYDLNGNILSPKILPIRTEGVDYTIAYMNEDLWKSDFKKYETASRNFVIGLNLLLWVALPTIGASIYNSPLGDKTETFYDRYMKVNRGFVLKEQKATECNSFGKKYTYTEIPKVIGANLSDFCVRYEETSYRLYKTKPKVYGMLLATSAISTLISTWLMVDTNTYNYPKYVDALDVSYIGNEFDYWRQRTPKIENEHKTRLGRARDRYIAEQYAKNELPPNSHHMIQRYMAINKDWDRSYCVKEARDAFVPTGLDSVKKPRIYKKYTPTYTKEALDAEIEGTLLLRVCIDRRGKVRAVKIHNGLGYGLDEKSIEAVKKWEFFPAEYGSERKTIHFTKTVEVRFEIKEDY